MLIKTNKKNLAAVVGFGLASTVMAAEEPVKAEDAVVLQEVVVTAQKREQNVQDTPIAVSAYDAQAIADKGVHDISDISTTTPNVQIAPSPGGSTGATIAIRGASMINPAITWEPAVGIYIDGVFISKNMGGLFDVADLERIEVLRGPQGTLYGRNTTGGAVNLVTRKPGEKAGGTAKLGLGNYGYFEEALSVDTGKLADAASFNVAINKRDRDGFYDNNSTDKDAADEFKKLDSIAARISALLDVAENVEVLYTYDMSEKENTPAFGQYEFPVSFTPAEIGEPERADEGSLDGAQYENTDSSGHAVTATIGLTDELTLKSITAFREMNFDDANDYDGFDYDGTYAVDKTFHTERHIRQEQTSQEFQLVGNMGDVNFVAGYFYFDDQADTKNPFLVWVDDTMVPFPIPAAYYPSRHFYGVESTSNALFGQADWAIIDALTLTAGLRYTEEKKHAYLEAPDNFVAINAKANEKWNNVSPMVALTYSITDDVSTYVKVSRGWKAGGFNAEAGSEVEAETAYDEEVLTAYEVGVKTRWVDDRIQANLAIFRNDVDDLQVSAWDPLANASKVSNAGEARVTGAELETLFAIVEGLTAFVNYGYLDTEYLDFNDPVSGAQLKDTAKFAYSPQNKYSVGMDYVVDVNFAALRARFDYSYTDSQYFYYDAYSAAVTASEDYVLVNARIALSDIGVGEGDTIEVALWGKNLGDEEYRLNGIPTSTGGAVNYYGDPRTFGVEAIYQF